MIGKVLGRIFFGLMLGAGICFLAWNFYFKETEEDSSQEEEEEEEEEEEDEPELSQENPKELSILTDEDLLSYIEVSSLAKVQSHQTLALNFLSSGTVLDLKIEEGDIVKEGERLALLEHDEDLPEDLEEMYELDSPADGTIVSLTISEGDSVTAMMPIAYLVDMDDLELLTYLDRSDALSLEVGDDVYMNDEVIGTIKTLSPVVDPTLNQSKLIVSLNQNVDLVPGESIYVDFHLDAPKDMTLVPISSVVFDRNSPYMMFVYQGKVFPVHVELGDFYGDYVAILDFPSEYELVSQVAGLEEGDTVFLSQE